MFGPNFSSGASVTLNDGVLNDGGASIPAFDPANPASGDFHAFTAADRFNYNGADYNYLRTPNERVNLFASARHETGAGLEVFATVSHTGRSSSTKAAPEPLCLGNGCGNRITDNFFISARNPYNPFGVDLLPGDGTLEFFGRRPLESGRRLFYQRVHTWFGTAGLNGEFQWGGRNLFWELYGSYGENRGSQKKYNSHNAAKLQVAMGDPNVCAATPGCVPFNFFGGQGPDGNGSITPEMLDFVTYTQRDSSRQSLRNVALNIAGDVFSLPAGEAGFAAGIEFRDHAGWFRPDPIAERGETAGIPAGSTQGGFRATEYYGELFGGAAREDFSFQDPCADVLGQFGSANGAPDVIDNQLQNIGAIEASGWDLLVAYDSPDWPIGRFRATFSATLLSKYLERTANVDGTQTVTDRRGTHTDETFQRAFPELRWVTNIDWMKDRWAGSLSLRWTDAMTPGGGNQVASALFTDARLSYTAESLGDSWTVSLGFNNLFDEDPPLCFPCGVIGMSQVAHDLPGRVGYLRVSYQK